MGVPRKYQTNNLTKWIIKTHFRKGTEVFTKGGLKVWLQDGKLRFSTKPNDKEGSFFNLKRHRFELLVKIAKMFPNYYDKTNSIVFTKEHFVYKNHIKWYNFIILIEEKKVYVYSDIFDGYIQLENKVRNGLLYIQWEQSEFWLHRMVFEGFTNTTLETTEHISFRDHNKKNIDPFNLYRTNVK